jgi:hypothetical protein
MDEAKAIINIKEGLIELSGPVDFVRQYLDRYQSAIKIETLPEKAPVAPVVKPAPPVVRAVKEPALPVTKAIKGLVAPAASEVKEPIIPVAMSVKGPAVPAAAPAAAAPAPVTVKTKPKTCIGAIRSSIQSGFFNEPRLLSDVRHHLDEEKVIYSERAVRAGLTRLARLGTLRMVGRGRGKRYSRQE